MDSVGYKTSVSGPDRIGSSEVSVVTRESSHAAWSLVSRGAAVTSQVETTTPHQLPAAGGGALTFLLQSLPYRIESIRAASTLPLS